MKMALKFGQIAKMKRRKKNMVHSAEMFDQEFLRELENKKSVRPADLRAGDIVLVHFLMRVTDITSGGPDNGQVFGFTDDGMCVSAPIRSIVEARGEI